MKEITIYGSAVVTFEFIVDEEQSNGMTEDERLDLAEQEFNPSFSCDADVNSLQIDGEIR